MVAQVHLKTKGASEKLKPLLLLGNGPNLTDGIVTIGMSGSRCVPPSPKPIWYIVQSVCELWIHIGIFERLRQVV